MRTGPAEIAFDADVLLTEVPREVLHRRVERRLRDAHDVVVRHRALAAEVRHRHDRAAAARLEQRLGGARARDERVRAHVEREPEAVARRVGEAALEILRRRERDRVHEQVEPAVERLADLARRRARCPRRSGRRTPSRAGCRPAPRARGRSVSIRSPWYVNASRAPPSASRRAIAHAIERLFATPRTSPVFPSKSTGGLYGTSATLGVLAPPSSIFAALAALTRRSGSLRCLPADPPRFRRAQRAARARTAP